MVAETAKTNHLRGPDFMQRYFGGRVLDIGCGDDLVVPLAEPFDMEQGDANRVLDYLRAGSYDSVHSSHCLEHMHNPPQALADWWALVRPGGYLVLVVPDEDLYEQGVFPSRFNSDHRASFRLGGDSSWSSRSWDIGGLVAALPGAELLSTERQDAGYDHSLQRLAPENWLQRLIRKRVASRLYRGLRRRGEFTPDNRTAIARRMLRWGVAVDQTRWDALAQIQIVAQKHG